MIALHFVISVLNSDGRFEYLAMSSCIRTYMWHSHWMPGTHWTETWWVTVGSAFTSKSPCWFLTASTVCTVLTGTTYFILCIPHISSQYLLTFTCFHIVMHLPVDQQVVLHYCIFTPTYICMYVCMYVCMYICTTKCVTVSSRVLHFLHCWRRRDFHCIVVV